MLELIWLVPLLPLAGAAVNLFAGGRLGKRAGWLGTAASGTSFVIALLVLAAMLGRSPEDRLFVRHLFDWIEVGSLRAAVDLRVDPLSVTMILVVTGVGSVIHLYSLGYMAGDPRFGRFFAYMNLFVFFMLMLVLADNFLLLFLGWEGVGLCSYLLIGFWFERTSASNAAKKAFVTTRIGDTAMLVGIALIFARFGSLGFSEVLGEPGAVSKGTATAIALLLLAGAIGKSAQVPLHVWLPDAMEGPTPVSALIHAATMVTAGVYLVVRTHALFEASEIALAVVLVIGLVTAVYAAISAVAQDDIKRVLAYSTISQLGFMFLAAGMRQYAAAMFLLVAHAFYKGLMFLGAGSVIHGLHDERDLQKMGGLWPAMPATAAAFAIGAASLAGIPPFAGFFAKDQILSAANHSGRYAVWVVGLVAAFFSALYIGRLLFLAFFGRSRGEKRGSESPRVMILPLALLAAAATGGGVLGVSATRGLLAGWLEPVVGEVGEGGLGLAEPALILISVVVAAAGVAVAWVVYASGRVDWMALRERTGTLQPALARGLYLDDAYAAAVEVPAKALARGAAKVDVEVIDGAADGIGSLVRRLASAGRTVQTGLVRNYALAFLLGVVGILLFMGLRS